MHELCVEKYGRMAELSIQFVEQHLITIVLRSYTFLIICIKIKSIKNQDEKNIFMNKAFNKIVSETKPYEEGNSPLFIDRYGQIHDSSEDPSAVIKARLGAFLVVCANGHILLTRPPWAPTVSELPGGGVDKHETVEEGAYRELLEETDLSLPKDIKPFKADEYYMNFCAEDVNMYYRYIQKFYFYNLDGLANVTKKLETTAEGSSSFWCPLDRVGELQLRVGHKHIIEEVAREYQAAKAYTIAKQKSGMSPK